MSADRCRTCKAEVVWATNADTGKAQIVDAEPAAKGSLLLFDTPKGKMCRVIPEDEREGLSLHLDHHATCPDVAFWRRRRSRP